MAEQSRRTVVVAHPSPDLYGSDRQLLVTLEALREHGWDAVAVLPAEGPLVPLLQARGAAVLIRDFPVLRKSLLSARGLLGLGAGSVRAVYQLRRLMRELRADAVLVNTVTIPTWIAAGRAARVPVVCHVHEAEEDQRMVIRRGLATPLLLCAAVITNSAAAKRALTDALPRLGSRVRVIHNGVPGPRIEPAGPLPRRSGEPAHLALVGRLSPRKGIDVALEALALLRAGGHDVSLTVCGTTFPGYEWYEDELRARAARPDLAGHVTLSGYVSPTWPVLESSDIVLVPSRVEPFGNAAVEGLLACRPVVAGATQGLNEVIRAGVTGLLVPPGDADALARAIASLLDDPRRAAVMAQTGHDDAVVRFSEELYRQRVGQVMTSLSPGPDARPPLTRPLALLAALGRKSG